jgi:hypothetical protein
MGMLQVIVRITQRKKSILAGSRHFITLGSG